MRLQIGWAAVEVPADLQSLTQGLAALTNKGLDPVFIVPTTSALGRAHFVVVGKTTQVIEDVADKDRSRLDVGADIPGGGAA